MAVSYIKLWKLLLDKRMTRADLRRATGIGPNTLAKLGKDELVSMDVMVRICDTLHCDIGDVMEVLPETEKDNTDAEDRNQLTV